MTQDKKRIEIARLALFAVGGTAVGAGLGAYASTIFGGTAVGVSLGAAIGVILGIIAYFMWRVDDTGES